MPKLISGPAQLETTHAATCKGFLELASAKSQKAAPYIKDAVGFWDELAKVHSPQELLTRPTLRDALISTAGVSAKTLQYLQPADVDKIIVGILDGISPERRKQFREEVFYRYLLTRGASLDGEMRNYIGAVAAMIFVVAVVDALQVKHDPSVYFAEEKTPKRLPEARTFARTHKTQKIEWEHRTLLFDKKPGIIGKNVDAILLNVQIPSGNDRTHLDEHKRYVAC